MRLALARLALAAGIGLAPVAAAAQPASAPLDKTEVEAILRDYILKNPEIVEEALFALEKKKAEAAAQAQKAVISEKAGVLFNSTRQVVLGNPKGDVTVVEFFDYNCGYCKRALADMMSILNEDKNVRFVLKEFPVLGQGSLETAQVAVAVNRVAPDKYIEFHKKMLTSKGEANKARAFEVVADIGLDRAKVEAAIKDPEVGATLEEVYALANGLGLTGTPSYVVGQTIVPGAIGAERLKAQIREARCGSTTC